MKLGIKIGSKALTNGRGDIYKDFISDICRQVSILMKHGYEVFIVSSGAVASDPAVYRSKNLRAAIGQHKLMAIYSEYLQQHGLEAAQMLVTDRDLQKENIGVLKAVAEEALNDNSVVPIFNANDVKSSEELKFLDKCADNDTLFKLICLFLQAEAAIVIFTEQGVINPEGEVLRRAKSSQKEQILSWVKGGNDLGYGIDGMKVKILSLFELSEKEIPCWLVPYYKKNLLIRTIQGDPYLGTTFWR